MNKKNNVKDVSKFLYREGLLDDYPIGLVIKSQDQSERRSRMVSSLKSPKMGRTETRPTSVGLLAVGVLNQGRFNHKLIKEYKEPRHIIKVPGGYAMTEVNSVVIFDNNFEEKKRITNKYFAFLHSIFYMDKGNKLLITSSGYDSVIEVCLDTGNQSALWCAWDNGFNPDEDGNWLSLSEERYEHYLSEGKRAIFINTDLYGEQGINTKLRTAHPNVAIYDKLNQENIIVSLGHGGKLYSVNIVTGANEMICDVLSNMPHGIENEGDGYHVTNTTAGQFLFLSKDFTISCIFDFTGLPGKPEEVGDIEWIQNTKKITNSLYLAIDANRGLIAFDIDKHEYCIYNADPEWCIQDAILIN